MQITVKDACSKSIAFRKNKDFESAIELMSRCLAAMPNSPMLWDEYGRTLYNGGYSDASLPAFRRALDLAPTHTRRLALSAILSRLRRFDEAVAIRAPVLKAIPENLDALKSQALDLRQAGRHAEVISLIETAQTQGRVTAKVKLQKAMSRLTIGDYAKGFKEYEIRIESENLSWQDTKCPRWAGEDPAGKSILVMPEQGMGDVILTSRFLPTLKALGTRVSMAVNPPLQRLLENIEGLDQMVRPNQPVRADFDYYTPQFSLPAHLNITHDTLPAPARLTIPDDSRTRAETRMAPYKKYFKIGIVWTGSESLTFNAARRIPLPEFIPLASLSGVQLVSLYKGPDINAIKDNGLRHIIVDGCSDDRDMGDCAAMVDQMDLLITCDTSVVHVAGSLGKPVWNLLPTENFWFYGLGDTTPWYPSMRLIRQTRTNDWREVFERVIQDLTPLVEKHRATLQDP